MPLKETAPEPGTWTIDTVHSFVSFTVEHMGLALARGIASGPAGTITIDPDLVNSRVTAAIDAATIKTGNEMRDAKVLGPDVLDTEKFPTIDFTSTAMRELMPDGFALDGELTLHGVRRPVTLELRYTGVITDSWGKTRLGVTAQTTLKRDEFGAGDFGHVTLPLGGIMVPHAVAVTLDIEATRDEA
jgi:polyisoprenoid-binding protein YceI